MEREEHRAKCCLAMGEELGFIYERLDNQLCWILMQTTQFTTLYSVSQDRVDLLNKACNQFFNNYQIVQLNYLHISIASCFDSPSIQKDKNISMLSLDKLVDTSINQQIITLLKNIEEPIKKLRNRRNKQLVHFDLVTATANANHGISILELKEITNKMGEILNIISSHYMNSTTHYPFVSESYDATQILYCLNDSLLFREASLERKLAANQNKYDKLSRQFQP